MIGGVVSRIDDLNTVLSQTTEHRHLVLVAAAKNLKTDPAKGAMAFQFASMYWCRWKGWGGADAHLAPFTREETCVN